jgi:hypothetical protein
MQNIEDFKEKVYYAEQLEIMVEDMKNKPRYGPESDAVKIFKEMI